MRIPFPILIFVFSFSLANGQGIPGACCLPDGSCVTVADEEDCLLQAGEYHAARMCAEVDCPDPIPTLSEWGIIGLGLALIIFGTVAVRSRKRELSL